MSSPPDGPAAEAAAQDVGAWGADLLATALVGTDRAPRVDTALLGVVPRPGAEDPVSLLDAAALAAALRAAAPVLPPEGPADVPASPPDGSPEAAPAAVAVLELLLTQAPASRELADQALRHWCTRTAGAGQRVPHRLLPAVLDAGTRREAVRGAVAPVLGVRGRWLAGTRPVWRWAAGPVAAPGFAEEGPTDADWAVLPSAEQLVALRRLRPGRPARARELVAAVLPTAPARHRADLLKSLAEGLSDEDEPLLEAALDDRAATVREVAAALLDGLPASRRAARCAGRLVPALAVEGLLRRRLRVAPLTEPDAAAVRDGIGVPPDPRGGRRQTRLLTDLVAAAPLPALLTATGTDPDRLLALDTEQELRPGLVRAALTRRDADWARALLARGWHAELAALLPADEHRALAAQRLLQVPDAALATLLQGVPAPWGRPLSAAVAERLSRAVVPGSGLVLPPASVLAGLDPAVGPVLQRALETARSAVQAADAALPEPGPGTDRATAQAAAARLALARATFSVLRDTVQLLSLLATIDEATR